MAYEKVVAQDGTYAVDWPTVYRIIENSVRARKQNEHARERVESQATANPFSWMLPDLTTLEVDWDRVNAESRATTDMIYMAMRFNGMANMRDQVMKLRGMVRETQREKDRFRRRLAATQDRSIAAIGKAVSSYDTAITASRVTRDLSAGTLLVGATVLSGGSAAAAYSTLTAGSLLKGTGKYQDTGNIAAASVEVVSNLMFGVIPVARAGKGLKGAEKHVLLVVQAQWDVGAALIEGKSVSEALATGGMRLVMDPVFGAVFESKAVTDRLQKWVVPGVAKVVVTKGKGDISEFVVKESEEIAKYVAGKAGDRIVGALLSQGSTPASTRADPSPRSLRGCVLPSEWLLNLAVIDMAKGVALP